MTRPHRQQPARLAQKDDTRRRIVRSAALAIRDRGIDAPSVGEVMSGAGLTVGGFYAHFENKDALMLEALNALFNERSDEWLEQLPKTTGEERRHAAARGYLSRKHRDATDARCALPAILSELPHAAEPFRAALERYLEQWIGALHDASEPDGRKKAIADLAMMIGALSIARALGPTEFSDELLAAAKAAIR
jgi:TetR/AcrR family transcriptional repressor of nem operon